jgi:hypothetical protein
MRSDLILHIGAPKTGTTALQYFLSKESKALHKAGCRAVFLFNPSSRLFAEMFGQLDGGELFFRRNGINSAYRTAWHFGKRIPFIVLRLAASSFMSRKTIISSEHLFLRLSDKKQISDLQKFLKPFFRSIRVVFYSRDKSDFAKSLYWEMLKAGGTVTLEDYLKDIPSHFDEKFVVSSWSEVFGAKNFTLIKYDKNMNTPIDFFIKVLGVDHKHLIELDRTVRQKVLNKSVSPEIFEHVRVFNESHPQFDQEGKLIMENRRKRDELIKQLRS